MNKQELFLAIDIFRQIDKWQHSVTKERFSKVALASFGVDIQDADMLYGLFCSARNNLCYVNSVYDKKNVTENTVLALNIAEETYRIYANNASVPGISSNYGYEKDKRRYFVKETIGQEVKRYAIDVNLKEKSDIVAFATLLQRECIMVTGVTHVLDRLSRFNKKGESQYFDYYEGDIVFVFGNPTDSMWHSWYRSKDSGVYLATDKGWRKLMYTPGRGYITKDDEVDYENEDHYSDYMICENNGRKDWRYVGNIHDDISVLVDKDAAAEHEKEEGEE